MNSMIVDTPGGKYPVYIAENALKNVGAHVREATGAARAMVVSDRNVDALYGQMARQSLSFAGLESVPFVIRPGEASKNMRTLTKLLSRMAQEGFTRTDAVLALGGGVVGDLAGFAAAVYMRGVPFCMAPTTLLSQIDASIGGKTAVDLKEGKNLAGAFYQPRAVVIDPLALQTLTPRAYRDGRAEMIKTACISDQKLFEDIVWGTTPLIEHIRACCDFKRRVVEEDERDTARRMILNFGHTIGHALEKISNYRLSHGRAVAAGMAHITQKSQALGLTEKGTAESLALALKKYGLTVPFPKDRDKEIKDAILHDKKSLHGKIHLVLLKRIGECFLYPVDASELGHFV